MVYPKSTRLIWLPAAISLALLFFNGCLEPRDEGPPTTTINNPPSGAVVHGQVPILVSAWDDKKVETIRLFVDGLEVTSANSDNLNYLWNTDPIADNQDHHITAYAIDDDGNIGASAITTVRLFAPATGDPLPPVVAVQNPLDNQTVSGLVNIAVGVNNDVNNPIDSVAFYIDGVHKFRDTQFPYIYTWDTQNLVNGSQHTIFAIAYDRIGFNASSSVITVTISSAVIGNITPPVVQIANPINQQTVSGLVSVVTRVENIQYNPVDSVVFVIDGFRKFRDTSFPYIYEWDATNLPNGSRHTIFSVAYDREGFNVSSGVINVTVSSNVIPDVTPPTVNLVFPAPGANNIFSVSALNSITVVADAQDDMGVDSVAFYIDGIFKGSDNTPLYQYVWNFSGYATGIDHTIYVRAFDTSGNVGAAFLAVRLDP